MLPFGLSRPADQKAISAASVATAQRQPTLDIRIQRWRPTAELGPIIYANRGYDCGCHDPWFEDRQAEEEELLQAQQAEISETEHNSVYGWARIRLRGSCRGVASLKSAFRSAASWC